MTQKKYEKRLVKKQFFSLMIRRAETREILRERRNAARRSQQKLQTDEMLSEILSYHKEVQTELLSLPLSPSVCLLLNYFEINVTSKLFDGCRKPTFIKNITVSDYEQFLNHFDFIKKGISIL